MILLRVGVLGVVVVFASGCSCTPPVTLSPDASVEVVDAGVAVVVDGGVAVVDAGGLSSIHPGAEYVAMRFARPGAAAVSSETRAFVVSSDGGIEIVERPFLNRTTATALSRDARYFYAFEPKVWRASDGASVAVRTREPSGQVVGETSDGWLVVNELFGLAVVSLDGTQRRAITDDNNNSYSRALLSNDVLVYEQYSSALAIDLNGTAPALDLHLTSVASVDAIGSWPIVRIIQRAAPMLWVDLKTPSTPVVVTLTGNESGFVQPDGAIGVLRIDGPAFKRKSSPTSSEETVHTASAALTDFRVFAENAVVTWAEGGHQQVADLSADFRPIAVPVTIDGHRPIAGQRRGYVSSSNDVLEVDFEAGTASSAIEVSGPWAVQGASLAFVHPTTHRLMLKRFGAAAGEVSTQRCWLLSTESTFHQCQDRSLYILDASGRQTRVAGAEVDGNPYAFGVGPELMRYFESRGSTGGEARLYDVATDAVVLTEPETGLHEYQLTAKKYVRAVGEAGAAETVYAARDLVSQRETTLAPYLSTVGSLGQSYWPDGGQVFIYESSLADGGAMIHLYDHGLGSERPIADAHRYRYDRSVFTNRFRAQVRDIETGKRSLVEAATGALVPMPVLSDGGLEAFVYSELTTASGLPQYVGASGIYGANFEPLVALNGFCTGVVDSVQRATHYLTVEYTPFNTAPLTLITVFDDGGVTQQIPFAGESPQSQIEASHPWAGAFLLSHEVDAGVFEVSSYQPGSGARVTRFMGSANRAVALPGGFLSSSVSEMWFSRLEATDAQALLAANERQLGGVATQSPSRLAIRTTVGGWREVKLIVIDLATLTRRTIFQGDAVNRVGAAAFSFDGTKLFYSVSSWDGTSSSLRVVDL